MSIKEEIESYIGSQAETKGLEMRDLHDLIQHVSPGRRLWFLDGKDSSGKTVSNPNIGYGLQTMKYADGSTRDFYQIGLSANTSGFSVYVMGLEDKKHLAQTYGEKIGKASVSGYCIKFKTLEDINLDVLEAAIRFGFDTAGKVKE